MSEISSPNAERAALLLKFADLVGSAVIAAEEQGLGEDTVMGGLSPEINNRAGEIYLQTTEA